VGFFSGTSRQPTPRIESTDMNLRSQSSGPSRGSNDTKTSDDSSRQHVQYSGNDQSQLYTTIEKLNIELRKQNHRYRCLNGKFRKAQNDKWQLRDDYNALELDFESLDGKYSKILDIVLIPYAQSKGLSIGDRTKAIAESVLRRVLHDATRPRFPQVQVQTERNHIQGSQNQIQLLREQLQTSQGQVQTLRSKLEISQKQVQASCEQLEESQGQAQALHNQVQELQRDLLARVEKTQVLSDDQFVLEFRSLVSMIRTLSRTIHISDTNDVVQVLASVRLLEGVDPQHWKGRGRKKTFIEAWCGRCC
jgi:hypothetical protein